MTEAESTPLPTTGDGAYLGAAGVLAALAYPAEYESRDRLVEAIRAYHTKRAIAADAHAWPVNPDLRAWRPRNIDTAIEKAGRLVNERLMAAQSLTHRISGNQRPGNAFIAQLRATHGIRHSDAKPLTESLDSQTEAARQRVWQRSLPVLHVAVALNEYVQRHGGNVYTLIEQPSWVAPIIERAEALRPLLEQAYNLPPTVRLYPE